MKFGDMTLREFAKWCWNSDCTECPFEGTWCEDKGITPFDFAIGIGKDCMDMEVPQSGKK